MKSAKGAKGSSLPPVSRLWNPETARPQPVTNQTHSRQVWRDGAAIVPQLGFGAAHMRRLRVGKPGLVRGQLKGCNEGLARVQVRREGGSCESSIKGLRKDLPARTLLHGPSCNDFPAMGPLQGQCADDTAGGKCWGVLLLGVHMQAVQLQRRSNVLPRRSNQLRTCGLNLRQRAAQRSAASLRVNTSGKSGFGGCRFGAPRSRHLPLAQRLIAGRRRRTPSVRGRG